MLAVLQLNRLLSESRDCWLTERRIWNWFGWHAVSDGSHATTYQCGMARWLSVYWIGSGLSWGSTRSHTSRSAAKDRARGTTLAHASTGSRSKTCRPYRHISLILFFRLNYLLKYISVLNFTGNFFLLKRQQDIKLWFLLLTACDLLHLIRLGHKPINFDWLLLLLSLLVVFIPHYTFLQFCSSGITFLKYRCWGT